MTEINASTPILVTGATGYLAGVIVKQLLEAGHTIHAPVRNPDNADKLKHLNAIAAGAPGQIKYFAADLQEPGSYAEAMRGCELVIHTASPFFTHVTDPEAQLIRPAVDGTANVLGSVNETDSVKRVVLTSSCAAIYGDNADVAKAPGGVLTEAVWNTSSSVQHQPYSYSKLLAEKKAWEMVEAQDRWDLVVINPSFILGPGINPDATGESYSLMVQMGDGTFASGVPAMGMGVVDVREVAAAHVRAGLTPSAEGRHILSGHNTDFFEMASVLRAHYGAALKLPKSKMPKFMVWLVGPLVNKAMTRKVVSLNVDVPWKADNSKSREALGIEYRALKDTLVDMYEDLIASGRLKPRKADATA